MELLEKNAKKSGIYKITNIVNNKFYIGSAVNIERRFKLHSYMLRYNKHYNKKLQNSFNKYGKDNFKIEVVSICPPEYCTKLEQWFINTQKPEFNLSPTANSTLGCKLKSRITIDIIKALNLFVEGYGVPDISKMLNITHSKIRDLIYRDYTARDIKKEINFSHPTERRKVTVLNNKHQKLTEKEIINIANLYNQGNSPSKIAETYNNINLKSTIAKIARGATYKQYSHLFNENINYYKNKK